MKSATMHEKMDVFTSPSIRYRKVREHWHCDTLADSQIARRYCFPSMWTESDRDKVLQIVSTAGYWLEIAEVEV